LFQAQSQAYLPNRSSPQFQFSGDESCVGEEPDDEERGRLMPMMDDVYGGSWLKAEDLPENFRGVLTVEHVSVQTVGDGQDKERKLALRFRGKEKLLLLNVTNANMMAEITGSRDYDHWVGRQVVLFRTMTDYAGKRVPALRLDHARAAATAAPPPRPVPPPPPVTITEPRGDATVITDDDVPFSLVGLISFLSAASIFVA
jgi:hypothetical protein